MPAGRRGETPVQRGARLLRDQAAGCRSLGSPLYADLLEHAATDLIAGGPTLAVLEGHLLDSGPSALALRLLAGAHALALTGEAPELAAFYPSTGGGADPGPAAATAWVALRRVFRTRRAEITPWLSRPPQTNEVGRGAALVGGLRHLAAAADLPVHLVEIGTSAGLNLRADRFRVDGSSGSYGDPRSPVQLGDAWLGVAPPGARFEIVDRAGGDLAPIDPTSTAGRLALTAYVWPDQRDRLARLRGALSLAEQVPATLRQESASQTMQRLVLADGAWTVVWHSVFWQYLDADERKAVVTRLADLGAGATDRSRLAHLSLEPRRRSRDRPYEVLVTLTTWPDGEPRVLGSAPAHGLPVTWE
jgi:hypothetical protein